MTKKLLLSAAAVAAMAFAGAANAGNLTTGSTMGGDNLYAGTKVTPYVVAKDFALDDEGIKTGNTSTVSSALVFQFNNTTNPNAVASTTDYVVTLKLTGPAKFTDHSWSTVTLGANATTETPILSADGKTLTIYAKTATVSSGTLADVVASGMNILVTGQETVSIEYKLQQVVGSQTLDLDSSNPEEIVNFKDALTFYTGTTKSVLAALPDFEDFTVSGSVTSGTFTAVANTVYNTNLIGDNVPAASSILTGYTAVVTGPQVEDLVTTFDTIAIAAATDVEANSATFTATSGADAFNLVLTPKTDTAISDGEYKATVTPTYATGWSGPESKEYTLVSIGLDGTNFYAPWFALNNGNANSTLRIANNGTSDIGPIVISLKANSAGTAATGTHEIESIAPGAFVSVTGTALKSSFGTTAGNGDLMVTVQSQSNNVSAKVRTTQTNGQTFENSLDILRGPAATAEALEALEAKVDAVQDAVDNIAI